MRNLKKKAFFDRPMLVKIDRLRVLLFEGSIVLYARFCLCKLGMGILCFDVKLKSYVKVNERIILCGMTLRAINAKLVRLLCN